VLLTPAGTGRGGGCCSPCPEPGTPKNSAGQLEVTGARPDTVGDVVADGDAGGRREREPDGAGLDDAIGVGVTRVGACGTARPEPETVTEQPAASSAATAAVHRKRMLRS
jgi:hypothetical protein